MSDYKPVVGEECEVFNQALDMPEWEKCKPLFMGEFVVVYASESCLERTARIENVDFRPIRTQEEKEREEAIDAMLELIDYIDPSKNIDILCKLYDAGYHLVGEKVDPEYLAGSFCNHMHQGTTHLAEHLLINYDIYRKVEK